MQYIEVSNTFKSKVTILEVSVSNVADRTVFKLGDVSTSKAGRGWSKPASKTSKPQGKFPPPPRGQWT
jgi:hypothetical protein